mgnify:FL=1
MPDYNRFHYKEVTSTNDICFEKCQQSEKPVVVSADKQIKGRGRNQKDWKSPHGNISYSFGYKSEKIISGTSIKTGLIAANAINKAFSIDVGLKWPNDLIYQSKKVGGILVETQNLNKNFITVIGVGINLQIDPEEKHWGDLNIDISDESSKETLIKELTDGLLLMSNNEISGSWESEWIKKCAHIGQFVKIRSENEYLEFLGIDSDGQMISKNKEGELIKIQESSIEVDGIY